MCNFRYMLEYLHDRALNFTAPSNARIVMNVMAGSCHFWVISRYEQTHKRMIDADVVERHAVL